MSIEADEPNGHSEEAFTDENIKNRKWFWMTVKISKERVGNKEYICQKTLCKVGAARNHIR